MDKLLIENIKSRIFEKKGPVKPKDFVFPKKLGDYEFLREIKIPRSYYFYAVYRKNDGKRAIAKIWAGKRKNISFYWLENEISVYESVNKIYQKHKSEITSLFPNVSTLKPVHIESHDDLLILLTEYVSGVKLNSLSAKSVNIYDKLIAFVDYLDKKIKEENIQTRLSITPVALFVSFILVAVKTFIDNPNEWKIIVRTLLLFLSNLPLIFDKSIYGFTHRDLSGNIIVSGRKYYVCDFQISGRGVKMKDTVNLVQHFWPRKKHIKEILQLKTVTDILTDNKKLKLFKILLSYSLLFDLSFNKNMRRKQVFSCLNFVHTF